MVLLALSLMSTPNPAGAGGEYPAYLPAILNQQPQGQGLWGHVTVHGQGVAGVQVLLRHIIVGQGAVITSSTTSGDFGIFSLTGLPSVNGQNSYYELRYVNGSDPSKVKLAQRPMPVPYSEGTTVEGGDLEIANLAQLAPPDGATVTFPATFTWAPNGVSSNYSLFVNCAGTTRSFSASDQDHYTLTSLPVDFSYGLACGWYVAATGPGIFYARSYDDKQVTFAAAGAER
jgi:hypothetical protein